MTKVRCTTALYELQFELKPKNTTALNNNSSLKTTAQTELSLNIDKGGQQNSPLFTHNNCTWTIYALSIGTGNGLLSTQQQAPI